MKRVFSLISFLSVFVPLNISAQQALLTRMASVEISSSLITVDHLGNIYIASEGTLKKLDSDGKLLYTYTGLSDSKIISVDVGDPLKILIFNSDFGKIKYLDNTLSLKKDFILLSDLGYANATLVAASYGNGFWLYDPFSNQVVRFDKNLKQTHNSGNCSDITGFEISPVFMTENDNMLYLCDPGNGILIFDRYASYMRLLPFKNLRSFQVISQKIIFSEGNRLKMLDLKTFDESVLIIPENEEIINALWNNDRVYVLKNKSLDIYSISK